MAGVMPVQWNQSALSEGGVPVDHAGLDGGQGRAGPVIDDLAAALHGAVFQEIDAQAVAAADDVVRADAILAQELAGRRRRCRCRAGG